MSSEWTCHACSFVNERGDSCQSCRVPRASPSKPASRPVSPAPSFSSPHPRDEKTPPEGGSLTEFCGSLEVPEWVDGEKCSVCQDKFSYGTSKHNCRLCGQVLCSRCTGKFEVPEHFKKKAKKGPARVCYGCEEIVRRCGKQHAEHWSIKAQRNRDKEEGKRHIFYVPIWEPIHLYKECRKCKKKTQGHNCRACGTLHCSNCTTKMEIPDSFKLKNKPGPARVCDRCRFFAKSGAVFVPYTRGAAEAKRNALTRKQHENIGKLFKDLHAAAAAAAAAGGGGGGGGAGAAGGVGPSGAPGHITPRGSLELEARELKIKPNNKLLQKIEADLCAGCHSPFGLFTRRVKCFHCPQFFCRKCVISHHEQVYATQTTLQHMSEEAARLGVGSRRGDALMRPAGPVIALQSPSRSRGEARFRPLNSRPRSPARADGDLPAFLPGIGEGADESPVVPAGGAKPGAKEFRFSAAAAAAKAAGGDRKAGEGVPSASAGGAAGDAAGGVESRGGGAVPAEGGGPAAGGEGGVDSKAEIDPDDPSSVFQVLGRLGEGSYGAVYKALDKRDGTLAALKVLEIPSVEELTDLQREIEFMQQCDTPYVVGFKGMFQKEKKLWIAMEYCDAGSLCDIMEICETTLTEDEIAVVMRETLVALKYLHSTKKIHRDIKGGNILITLSGQLKLADFGVSCILNAAEEKRRTMIGTPYWMAPEVLQSQEGYDAKADIWSLGITALELAKGAPPLAEIHPMRAIFKIPNNPPPVLPDPDNWSPEFNDFLKQCLEKDATKRPSAGLLLETHPFIQKAGPNAVLVKLAETHISEIEAFREREVKETQKVKELAEQGKIDINNPEHIGYATAAFPSGTMVDVRASVLLDPSSIGFDAADSGTLVPRGAIREPSDSIVMHGDRESVVDFRAGRSEVPDYMRTYIPADKTPTKAKDPSAVPDYMRAFMAEDEAPPKPKEEEIPLYMRYFLVQEKAEAAAVSPSPPASPAVAAAVVDGAAAAAPAAPAPSPKKEDEIPAYMRYFLEQEKVADPPQSQSSQSGPDAGERPQAGSVVERPDGKAVGAGEPKAGEAGEVGDNQTPPAAAAASVAEAPASTPPDGGVPA